MSVLPELPKKARFARDHVPVMISNGWLFDRARALESLPATRTHAGQRVPVMTVVTDDNLDELPALVLVD